VPGSGRAISGIAPGFQRADVFLQVAGVMFRSFFAVLGVGLVTSSIAMAAPPYAPYANQATDAIYNLLFCDDIAAFRPKGDRPPTPWQTTLFSEPADIGALQALAADASQEGRIRALSYQRLRNAGQKVPGKVLLGVVVEVPLEQGLDTLAAYSEGGVRYINQTGKMGVFENVPGLQPLVQDLFKASQLVVDRIGPTEQPRLPPPKPDGIRITFLVSDGLYFGEGAMARMQHDQLAGPVIDTAIALLQQVVAIGTKSDRH
jgi:hypothetical protein